MKKEDLDFLRALQSRLREADKDPAMNDGQANPRFWAIKDAVLVPDEEGESYIYDSQNTEMYPLDVFCQIVDEEVRDTEDSRIIGIWQNVDKRDDEAVSEFANAMLDKTTDPVGMREDYRLVENTFFLTKKAAEKHIAANSHHYRKPHTYAMTAWRSPEFERFMELFKKMDLSDLKVEREEFNKLRPYSNYAEFEKGSLQHGPTIYARVGDNPEKVVMLPTGMVDDVLCFNIFQQTIKTTTLKFKELLYGIGSVSFTWHDGTPCGTTVRGGNYESRTIND